MAALDGFSPGVGKVLVVGGVSCGGGTVVLVVVWWWWLVVVLLLPPGGCVQVSALGGFFPGWLFSRNGGCAMAVMPAPVQGWGWQGVACKRRGCYAPAPVHPGLAWPLPAT